ncbi:MAG: hypothetical protein WBG69_02500 [Arcobacteraceae bacterium]
MQKIKYIIIFTLTLALGILYLQLTDYQNITNMLLQENTSSNTKTKNLENKILSLTEQNTQLQNRIISLEEALAIKQIELNNLNFNTDNNTTLDFSQHQKTFDLPTEKPEVLPVDVKPNITLDEENKITGFGIEYKQQF